MADRYEVLVKVVSQKGTCARGHKVGDLWIVGGVTPEGLCMGALAPLIPDIRVLWLGGSLPWSGDPESCTVACPDPDNPVVFELRRIRK